MHANSALLDSPALNQYAERLSGEVARIIQLTHDFPRILDIGDPFLRKSLHLEATALACHWLQSFSEDTPEFHQWSLLFSKRLIMESEAQSTFSEAGFPAQSPQFFQNRLQYYRTNGATWKTDETLFLCWIGAVNFCALFRPMQMPPLFGPGQDASHLFEPKGSDQVSLQATLGVDPQSEEYLELIGKWLNDFTLDLAKIAFSSSRVFLLAITNLKNQQASTARDRKLYKRVFLAMAGWCALVPFLEYDAAWIGQVTRIGIALGAGFLIFVLYEWRRVVAVILAILFNPIAPIGFSKDGWLLAALFSSIYFTFVALRPTPGGASKSHSQGS